VFSAQHTNSGKSEKSIKTIEEANSHTRKEKHPYGSSEESIPPESTPPRIGAD